MPASAPAEPWQPSRQNRSRLNERAVLRIGLLLSVGFMTAALIVALATASGLQWAAIHLALAGASMTAVGTFMPHFGVTLSGASPSSPRLRLGGVASLAIGGALVVIGVALGPTFMAFAGAAFIWVGLGITAWTTFVPARDPLARRHPMAQIAYAVALVEVAIGISLPVLLLAGWDPAVAGWSTFKPVHAWLNLFGFVSLTITATLVYLYPTIVGTRIRMHPSLMAMVLGGIVGPPLVVVAAIFSIGGLAIVGAGVAIAGAIGQLAFALDVWRRRARWTTDPGWHRLTTGHITAGMAWYLVALVTALVGIVRDGPAPSGWMLGALALPLIAGWTLQVLIGTASHLVPAMVTSEHTTRARQRVLLARTATGRLVSWNAGVLLAWIGLGLGSSAAAVAGVALLALAGATSITRLARALLVPR
jgi:nitrite reductase (NO-forming)